MENADGGAVPAAPQFDPLKIELRPISSLKDAKRNARTHSDRQIAQIAASIEQFGFLVPVLVDDKGSIVAGHGRVKAAKVLGRTEVPVIAIEHLSAEELRLYALADNKIALNAGWDDEALKIELEELHTAALELDIDIEITGFSTTEIDIIVEARSPKEQLDAIPELDRRAALGVERGDLWQLGKHLLLCGDSLDPTSFAKIMGAERARMVFSDPPYNVKIGGHVSSGKGKIRHDEFAMASGEMSDDQFTRFLETAFRNAADVSMNGAIHFQCMDWRHEREMLAAGHAVYSGLANICVWVKPSGGMGSFYRSRHEFIYVWKVGTAPHLNNVELGRNGRNRDNVWEYRAASKTGKNADLTMHPTVKPVPMIINAIKDTSRRDEIVLDCFGGSGSTLIAAEKTARRARLIEYAPKYCEETIRRWQKLTGKDAVLMATGETFNVVHARRGADVERLADLALGLEDAA